MIEIFGREAGTYGLMAMLGLIACLFVGAKLIKRFGVDSFDYALAMIVVLGGMVVGASLIYGLSNIRVLIASFSHLGELGFKGFWNVLTFCFGGMVFYGGFIGGGIALHIYTKARRELRPNHDGFMDVYAVMVPLFHAFGRVGCFLGGCCYGVESAFGFTTHTNTLNPPINGVNRFPVQLLESGCNLVVFIVLLVLFKKHIMEKRLIYVYMLIYPIIRFSDEFLRGDTYRGIFFGLSTSQWISIFLFVFALIMLPLKSRKLKQKRDTAAPSADNR